MKKEDDLVKRSRLSKYVPGLLGMVVLLLALSGCGCEHEFSNWMEETAATCSTEGTKVRVCSNCNEIEKAAIPATEHSYGDWAVTSEATCAKPGIKTITCTSCGDTKTEEIAMIAHSYDNGKVTTEATCTSTGVKTITCASCGDTKTETIAKKSHSYDSGKVTTEATCTQDGTKTITCTICGSTKTETIKKLGHVFDNNMICTRCNEHGSLESIMTSSEKRDADKVYWRSGITVNHDDHNKSFSIQFTFQDKEKTTYLKVPAVVELSIVDDDGATVYSATKILRTSDYNGSQAVIRIKDSEIKGGTNTYGNISIKVYNTGYFSYDPVSVRIYGDLPLAPITVHLPTLPMTIHDYDYRGNIDSSVKISEITYELHYDDSVVFYVDGEKLYDAEGRGYSQSTKVGWKLYDMEGYIIDSGTFYSPGIKVGEKYRDEDFYSFDSVKPGGTYRLEILSVD